MLGACATEERAGRRRRGDLPSDTHRCRFRRSIGVAPQLAGIRAGGPSDAHGTLCAELRRGHPLHGDDRRRSRPRAITESRAAGRDLGRPDGARCGVAPRRRAGRPHRRGRRRTRRLVGSSRHAWRVVLATPVGVTRLPAMSRVPVVASAARRAIDGPPIDVARGPLPEPLSEALGEWSEPGCGAVGSTNATRTGESAPPASGAGASSR
jgi:hypothetical protein